MTAIQIDTPRWAKPLLGESRYKGAYGGRGSGKSHFFAELAVEECAVDPNQSVICVREVQRSLKHSAKLLIEQKISALNVGDYFRVQHDSIKSTRGNGQIVFQGMQNHTAESVKSFEGFKRAWVEEAQTMSQRSLDMLRPTIRADGSQLWFSWNPREETDPVDALLRGLNPPPDSAVVRVNYNDNPWFPDVLREEMEYDRARDVDKYEHIWLGGYVRNSESRVFKNWRIAEFDTPDDAIHRFGADWGFAVDPTVLVRCHIVGRTLYIDHEAYMVNCEIMDTPALFMTVPDSEKWPIVADSSRPETISHMRDNGFPKILPAVKGKGSVEDGIEWLKTFDIVVHPRCVHTADELLHYSYKIDPMTDEVLPVLADTNNHVIDALRYACEAVRRTGKRESGPVTFSAPKVRRA